MGELEESDDPDGGGVRSSERECDVVYMPLLEELQAGWATFEATEKLSEVDHDIPRRVLSGDV
eukprot:482801-Hanusia_phi.AAC.2